MIIFFLILNHACVIVTSTCMAHATVAGIGILIEKSFQPGRRKINEQGYEVYSLARIKYMDEYQIDFIEEN